MSNEIIWGLLNVRNVLQLPGGKFHSLGFVKYRIKIITEVVLLLISLYLSLTKKNI
jgi:hypothetical protein